MNGLYIYHKGKKLKCGHTTGSCATAAAKAAALMLKRQRLVEEIEIDTPAGYPLVLKVEKARFDKQKASCCVIKDAGDDHDVTDGMAICAEVEKRDDTVIIISGGPGIGRITKPGFWGKCGEAAINPVPLQMIRQELANIEIEGVNVTISAPEGRAIAEKTLNSKLGIVDGISILGTTGIVEPMSNEALKQTIYLEIDAIARQGSEEILLHLGNYGKTVAEELNLTLPSVKIANFIGDAVLYSQKKDFKRVVLIGHIGKLCKLSLGAFNTHSSVCDLRIEAFVYYLALAGAPQELLAAIVRCTDSEEALELVMKYDYGNIVTTMRLGCIDRIRTYVNDPDFNIELYIYSLQKGLLDES